jgi:hypothetical protein
VLRSDNLTTLKSGSLNFLKPLGPVKACNGIALPLLYLTVLIQYAEGNILYKPVTGHHLGTIYLALYRKGIDNKSHFSESPQYSDFVYYFSCFSIIK